MANAKNMAVHTLLLAFVWLFTYLFSEEFAGEKVINFIRHSEVAEWSRSVAAVLLLAMYLFDAELWDSAVGRLLRWACVAIIVLCAMSYLCFTVAEQPAAPMSIFALALPSYALFLRQTLLRDREVSQAMHTLKVGFGMSAASCLLFWVVWLFYDPLYDPKHPTKPLNNFWSEANKKAWADEVNCNEIDKGTPVCQATLLMWAAPVVFGVIAALMSLVTGLLGTALTPSPWRKLALARKLGASLRPASARSSLSPPTPVEASNAPPQVGRPEQTRRALDEREASAISEEAAEQHKVGAALNMLQGVAYAGLFVLIVLHCVARLVGSNMGVGRSLYLLCGTAVVGIAVLFVMAVGLDALSSAASPMLSILRAYLRNSWVQGLLVFFCAPLLPCVMGLSAANQLVRRATCRLKQHEEAQLLTSAARVSLAEMREWDWTQVLIKVCYIGLILWWGLVFTLPTYMLLSAVRAWLIAQGGSAPAWLGGACGLGSAVFFVIGMVLFLLPPVPGPAMYVVSAMVLPAPDICGEAFASGDAGFYWAIVWTVVLCTVMKLGAHVVQQKVFGERLGSYTSVLSLISINSSTMKAIRFTLEKPGLNLGKVCILCAGPDWPTSVLCGILKLSVWETLLGLTPIFLPSIGPIATSAALSQRAAATGDEGLESIADVITFLALVLMVATQMGIVAITDGVLTGHQAELAKYEDIEGVLWLGRQKEKEAADFRAATSLQGLSVPMRGLICSAAVSCWAAGTLQFMGAGVGLDPFEQFEVTDAVSEVLCLSCDKALVKPAGWVSIAAMVYGTVALNLFSSAGSRRAARSRAGGEVVMI